MTDEQTPLPGMWSPPPIGCTTQMLIAFLNAHFGFNIPPDSPFHRKPNGTIPGVVGHVQARYGAIEAKNMDKGLFPSDAWSHVQTCEKRIRGGQKSLFAEVPA